MGQLEGRSAFITGGTSGIGLATARRFAAEGARVAVCGSSPESVAEAATALGPGHLALVCDIVDLDALDRTISRVRSDFGPLDICYANAGITFYKPLDDWTPDDFDRLISVNMRGQFFTLQKASRAMRDGGVMILTGSIASKLGQPHMALYAASKAAAPSFARTIAADLLPRKIRVFCLTPGPVDTNTFVRGGLSPTEAQAVLDKVSERVPIGRFGSPDEIAAVAVFLASDASSYMLGAEVVVDGGKSAF